MSGSNLILVLLVLALAFVVVVCVVKVRRDKRAKARSLLARMAREVDSHDLDWDRSPDEAARDAAAIRRSATLRDLGK